MSKPKVGKQRTRVLKKGQDKLENEEKLSKLELERQNLKEILRKRQIDVAIEAAAIKEELIKLKEQREKKRLNAEDKSDMSSIIPRLYFHEDMSYKIHLSTLLGNRKKLEDELKRAENELQDWIQKNQMIEKQIETSLKTGETKINALHSKFPGLFDQALSVYKDDHETEFFSEESEKKASELHLKLKKQLIEIVPLLPPSKY